MNFITCIIGNKMTSEKILSSVIEIHPKDLTSELKVIIEQNLYTTKGTLKKNIGRIDEIVEIIDIQKGTVRPIDNMIVFKVIYKARVFMPRVGDIYDAIIMRISDPGIMCNVHNMDIFIPISHLLNDTDTYKCGSNIKVKLLGVKIEDNFITFGEESEFII